MGWSDLPFRRGFLLFSSVILGLVSFEGTALGQAQVTASITGNVQDATGAVVRDATITVKSEETGAERTVTTDDSGNYRIFSFPLGLQELKAEKQGFKTALRTGVSLAVGQEAVVNFHLELGDLVQQIAVSEEAPIVNVTTASVSGMVNERQIKELPLTAAALTI